MRRTHFNANGNDGLIRQIADFFNHLPMIRRIRELLGRIHGLCSNEKETARLSMARSHTLVPTSCIYIRAQSHRDVPITHMIFPNIYIPYSI